MLPAIQAYNIIVDVAVLLPQDQAYLRSNLRLPQFLRCTWHNQLPILRQASEHIGPSKEHAGSAHVQVLQLSASETESFVVLDVIEER
jgi:hypothetical protein